MVICTLCVLLCLQALNSENKVLVVNTLCNAVMAYCAKWQIKRAEKLAVYCVQFARYLQPTDFYLLNCL